MLIYSSRSDLKMHLENGRKARSDAFIAVLRRVAGTAKPRLPALTRPRAPMPA